MPSYDTTFFNYVNSGALRSARALLPLLQEHLQVRSVLDVGCGHGGWLKVWRELGCQEVHGIDGDYVERELLLVETDRFSAFNLAQPFDLERQFDLVQCLEVGEHLPKASSKGFIDSIVRHAPIVFFSAAARGQGGDSHVNEQDYEFWRKLFTAHDYVAIDFLRPLILDQTGIEPWYRYNAFLYVARDKLDSLPTRVKQCIVGNDEPLSDISPALYQLRKALVRQLPVSIATRIAKIKEAFIVKTHKSAQTVHP